MADRFRTLDQESFDVIIVGAGKGGLTAGAILAKHGHSVLVVDQHYVAGGNSTVFRRPGYEFDVGIHYIGDCGPNGAIPRILRAAGIEGQEFIDLDPDAFDVLYFPDFTFNVPKDIETYRARLLELFPSESYGIDRYLTMLRQAWTLAHIPNRPIEALWKWPQVLRPLWYMNKTLATFFDSCTKDPKLRAVLTGNQIIYALPPSRVAALMHMLGTMHYMQGPCYPKGGGQAIADKLADAIETRGGKILLNATVSQILVEDNKAKGIVLFNKHVGERTVRAPIVISNADLIHTMRDLVGLEHYKPKTVEKYKTFEMSPGLGVVYVGADCMPEGGLPNRNHVIFPEYDVEPLYEATAKQEMVEKPYCCMTIASAKDPENEKIAPEGIVNMQLMGVVPSAPEAWGTTQEALQDGSYRKEPAYLAAKEAFAERMIALGSQVFPDLASKVVFQEVCTPLTHVRYTGSTNGTSYGLAVTPQQFLFTRPDAKTDIEGLHLCGANLRSGHGVPGVMMSGLVAASFQLGGESYMRQVLGKANEI